jgi:DNA primase
MDVVQIKNLLRELGVSSTRVTGGWVNSKCPLAPYTHAGGVDKKPSFGIAINEQGKSSYNCYACGHKGHVENLVRDFQEFSGEDYSDLLEEVIEVESSISLPSFEENFKRKFNQRAKQKKKLKPLSDKAYENIFIPAVKNKEAVKYLKARGITKQAVESLNLQYDKKDKRILFEVRDYDCNLYGYTGRTILDPKDYPNDKYYKVKDYFGLEKKEFILGEDRFEEGKPVLVVEGLFAFARLLSVGAENIFNVCALLGNRLTEGKRDRLIEFNHPVYLALDDDEGGRIGLYGSINPKTKKHSGRGAIRELRTHLPVYVYKYSYKKRDLDNFDYQDVENIILNTSLFS